MATNKDNKYFFHHNNFDAPQIDENAPPPPPILSLEELGFAKDDAFEKGRQQGLTEASQSREQYLAGLMAQIGQEIKFLLGAEHYRAAVYEREVLTLTETILQVLFPYLTEQHGLDEIKSMILKVVESQPDVAQIKIEVPTDDLQPIEDYLKTAAGSDFAKLEITSATDLQPASCRLSWKDGHALRDHQGVANTIYKRLRPNPAAIVDEEKASPLAQDDKKDDNIVDSEGETDHG